MIINDLLGAISVQRITFKVITNQTTESASLEKAFKEFQSLSTFFINSQSNYCVADEFPLSLSVGKKRDPLFSSSNEMVTVAPGYTCSRLRPSSAEGLPSLCWPRTLKSQAPISTHPSGLRTCLPFTALPRNRFPFPPRSCFHFSKTWWHSLSQNGPVVFSLLFHCQSPTILKYASILK